MNRHIVDPRESDVRDAQPGALVVGRLAGNVDVAELNVPPGCGAFPLHQDAHGLIAAGVDVDGAQCEPLRFARAGQDDAVETFDVDQRAHAAVEARTIRRLIGRRRVAHSRPIYREVPARSRPLSGVRDLNGDRARRGAGVRVVVRPDAQRATAADGGRRMRRAALQQDRISALHLVGLGDRAPLGAEEARVVLRPRAGNGLPRGAR